MKQGTQQLDRWLPSAGFLAVLEMTVGELCD
jgi:hypothetical protein